jgi:hypothetical protein
MALVYVDDVLCIGHDPEVTMKGTKPDYKKLASYWIIFRVRTQLTLPAIRKNSLVSNVILETKGRLSSYP